MQVVVMKKVADSLLSHCVFPKYQKSSLVCCGNRVGGKREGVKRGNTSDGEERRRNC